jgi:hypothetical protein
MFDSTIRSLASAGHDIRLIFNLGGDRVGHDLTDLLLTDHPSIAQEYATLAGGSRAKVIALISAAIDWMRYRDPRYATAPKLAERANTRISKAAPGARRVLGVLARVLGWRRAIRILEGLLQAMPPDRAIMNFMHARPCDVVVVSPLVDFGSEQVEYLLAAKALGRRTALLVHSWDNLTNKGLIRVIPDRVLVWNEAQKAEAVDMHGVAADRIVVTGAQCYDVWYDMKPTETRESFCERMGLDTDRPYVLFTGSSAFIGSNLEPDLVRGLRSALNKLIQPGNTGLQVLVRPHPQNAAPWDALADGDGLAVYPRGGALPVAASAQRDYFDSVYHAAAVVGVNTSAMIEASILDRPVLSVLDPRFRDTQQGTLHFHHLLDGGHLLTADNIDLLAEMLYQAARGELEYRLGTSRFLDAFIRPHGSTQAGTPKVVDALLTLCIQPEPAPTTASLRRFVAKVLLRLLMPAAALMGRSANTGKRRKTGSVKTAGGSKKSSAKNGSLAKNGGLSKRDTKQMSAVQLINKPFKDLTTGKKFFSDAIKEREGEMAQRLRRRCAGKRVILGPWLSEVGYEILYWVPFVRWMVDEEIFDPQQAVLVTRGGAEVWYPGLYKEAIDIFSLYSTQEFRRRNDERILAIGTQKHLKQGQFDLEIVQLIEERIGEPCEVIHPEEMYRFLQPLLSGGDGGRAPMEMGRRVLHYRRLPEPNVLELEGRLPQQYVAVKFYFRSSFADTSDNRAYVGQLLSEIASRHEIVLLNTRMEFDEHSECEAAASARIHRIDDLLTPANNLAVQSAVIARAQAFFGTYGGLSYVPLCYGVPSFAFKGSDDGLNWTHLHFANEFAIKQNVPFHLFHTQDFNLIRDLVRSS